MEAVRLAILLLSLCLLVPSGSFAQTPAPSRAAGPTFAATPSAIRAALCGGRRCPIDFVLPAGPRPRGAPLAVVRVRLARGACVGEDGEDVGPYRDWLVSVHRGTVRRERLLVRGDIPCLEWELSSWTFEQGELVFEYGMMGAPAGAGSQPARTVTRFRPWPLAITAQRRGDRAVLPLPAIPARGPLFVLSMEYEGASL